MALVGNISGSSAYNSNIGISGSVVIANRPDALFPTLNSVGGDVVFFVSGSRGGKGLTSERTVAVFGGDTVVSGTLTVGTGSIAITSNDITFFGGAAQVLSGSGGLTLKDSSGQVTVSQIIAGITPATPAPVYWTSTTANEIFTTGSVTVQGNLTVQGTTTTIDTQNLLVEDPVIYFGSGSVGSNRNGGIALASGSSVAGQALVWGRVANDTWGSGRLDVTNGTVTDMTTMTLTPMRASQFQVNGTVAAIKEDTGGIIVSGSTVFLESSTSLTRFMQNGFNDSLRVDVSNATNPIILANAGGLANQTLVVSGTSVVMDSNGGTTSFKKDGVSYVTAVTSSYTTPAGTTANAALVTARDGIVAVFGGTGAAVVSGSVVNFNAGSTGIRMQKDGLTFATFASGTGPNSSLTAAGGQNFTVGTTTGGTAIISGSNGVQLNSPAAVGSTFVADGSPMLVVMSPGAGQASIDLQGSFSTLSIGGADSPLTTMNIGTGAETLTIGEANSTTTFGGGVIPGADVTYDLGSQARRWKNIYTGDLHLRNERGDYTLIEEEDFLSIRFNKTGKRYKFLLEPVPELDEK